jgi:signal recognition particle subunit SRP54
MIDGSRRKRIARGSGTTVEEVNQLLSQYRDMRLMMRQLAGGQMPSLGALTRPKLQKARKRRGKRRKR